MAIGNVHDNGSNVGGVIDYVFSAKDHKAEDRPEVRVVGTSMSSKTKSALEAEFKAIQGLRPTLGKNTLHWTLSFPEVDSVSHADMGKMSELIAERMGVDAWMSVSHGNHFHFFGSRVNLDGSVVSDQFAMKRYEAVVREIEKTFGLQEVAPSHLLDDSARDEHRRTIPLGEAHMHSNSQSVPAQLILQNIIDDVLLRRTPITASEFVEALEAHGVDVRPNIASTGKLSGFSYAMDGRSYTSKQLGKGYTLGSLEKKGLTYDPTRDAENCRAAAARSEAARLAGSAERPESDHSGSDRLLAENGRNDQDLLRPDDDRTRELGEEPAARSDRNSRDAGERRDASEDAEGDSPEEHRGDAPDDAGGAPEPSGTPEVVDLGVEQGTPAPSGADEGNAAPSGAGGEVGGGEGSVPKDNAGGGRSGGSGGGGGSNSAGLSAGGGSADYPVLDGDDWAALIRFFKAWAAAMRKNMGDGGVPKMNSGPSFQPSFGGAVDQLYNLAGSGRHATTEKAIASQLRAFGTAQFEVQAIPPKGSELKPDRLKTLDFAGVMKHRAYFAAKNMQGYDIYVRPAPHIDKDGEKWAQPYIFVDDLSAHKVALMEANGLPLAVKVESSPDNFHGWVRVGEYPISKEQATAVARIIQQAIGGDQGAADWRHYGRLAGFTNQKPSRRMANGKAPFAKLTVGPEGYPIAPQGQALLDAAQAKLDAEAVIETQPPPVQTRLKSGQTRMGASVFDVVQAAWQRHHSGDKSSTDLSAALAGMRAGFDDQEVLEALRQVSPDLQKRKGASAASYLQRTVERAREVIDGPSSGMKMR